MRAARATRGILRGVNTAKDALIIPAVGLATTAFTGFSILRALKAGRWGSSLPAPS